MPIEYRVEGATGVVRSRGWGVVTPQQIRDHVRHLIDDDTVCKPLREVWDGTDVSSFTARGDDIRAILDLAVTLKSRLGGARLAIVAPTQLLFGMARMASLLSDFTPHDVVAFRTLAKALDWIEQPVPARAG